MKKLLIIFLILFLSSAFALGVYNFIILPHRADIGRPGTEQDILKREEDQKNRVFAISKEAVIGQAISADKAHLVYYLKSNGNVIQADLDGRNTKTISSYFISNISRIEWSPEKDKAACSRIENNQEINYIYSYNEKKKYDLSSNLGNIRFSPNNKKIAYNFINSAGENSISIADSDGANWNAILNTRLSNPEIQWIDSLKIAIYEHPSYKKSSSILIVDTSDSHLDRILSGKYGLAAKFSPDGKKLVYSAVNSEGKELKMAIYNISESKEQKIETKTFAEKCAWSVNNRHIFCSVPQNMPYDNLPDQFYSSKFSSKDILIKIDSQTGEEEVILPKIDSLNIDARELFLSPTEDRIYFINHIDEKLYGVSL